MTAKRSFAVLMTAFILLLMLVPGVSASGTSAVETLADPDGEILCVSNGGLWHEYPENSLKGVMAAAQAGADFVLTDVRMTKDGDFVLFRDEDPGRMTGSENKKISELTNEEIARLYLKEGCGGAGAKTTEEHPAFLDEALKAAEEKGFSLMLRPDITELSALCAFLSETGYNGKTALLVNAKPEEIAAAEPDDAPLTVSVKRGNVIFAVNSHVRKTAADPHGAGVVLKTTNRYGVNFHQTVLSYFKGNLRAVADTSDPALCGAREDSEKWWNDLISRGYSVFITDEPAVFKNYMDENRASRERLASLVEKYTVGWTLPAFRSNLFNDYKKAYTDAVTKAEALLADASSSLQDMEDCAAALQKSVDNIQLNYEALENGTAGMTVSAPRIGLCIGAAAAVIAVQIYFWKKRRPA